MNMFEFQFRWGRKRSAFGVDVNAPTIDEAVTKANRFFNSNATVSPVNHPDAERLWINVATPITPKNIGSIPDVINGARILDSQLARRVAGVLQAGACVNSLDPFSTGTESYLVKLI